MVNKLLSLSLADGSSTVAKPQSAHLWWPAVAKLQAASVPIALAAAPWDRQTDRVPTDRQTDGSRYRLIIMQLTLYYIWAAHWHQLANTTQRSVRGDDAKII